MADYEIDDPEMKIECPYDKAHMVRKKRMQYHLIKCRRNHVSKDFAVCPFNATHEMPRPELRHHMLTCRDRAVAEKTIRYEEAKRSATNQPILKGNTDVPAYNTYELVETENWDLEVATHPKMGVDPSFFHMNTRRSLAGLTPLEKRKFHSSLIPDMADYNIDETEQYRPVGMAPEPPQERKVRLPKAKSQAETLFEEQRSLVKQPKGPSTVFQYSLAMAGVGRGRGMLSNPPPPFTKPGGIGNGDGPQHVMPASLQVYSLKNSRQNRDSPPPANIMAYMLKNGKKTSISSSNNSTNASADNSSNEACSDEDFDGVKAKKQPSQSVKDGSSTISSYVLKQPARGRGRGMARQNENKVYNPQVIKPIQNTGIGRGARLQNGNLQPEPAINPNSWASMVNDSRKESRQSTPSPSMISNGYNSNSGDFPALNSSNQFPPSNQPTNGHLNKTDIKTGSLSDHSSGRTTPNNWFDDDIKEDGNIEENCNDEILELAKKQSKNLRKKLVGISKLEEKRNKGVKLTPDELAKVNKRSEFEKELKALSITR